MARAAAAAARARGPGVHRAPHQNRRANRKEQHDRQSVRIDGPMRDRYDEVLTAEALALPGRPAPGASTAARPELLRLREQRYAELAAGGTLDFLDETKDVREDDSWRVADAGARPGRPAGRDHRADRPQDDDQRAQLRRQGVAGRPRGRQHPAVGEHRRRASSTCATRSTARIDFTLAGGQGVRARPTRSPTIVVRPRGWHLPEKHILVDGERDLRQPHRLRALLLPLRARRRSTTGSGPYFYLPKMESHLEARLWNDVFVARAGRARHPARHHPGHRADRDLPGRVRDGGDPLRAARALGRAQRRPLGLHVPRHQDVPDPRRRTSCCPTATR